MAVLSAANLSMLDQSSSSEVSRPSPEDRSQSDTSSDYTYAPVVCPTVSELFAFRINLRAYLPSLDDTLQQKFEDKRKVYVGHVSEVFGLYHPENPLHSAAIYLLARGRPPAGDSRYGSPEMAVAIQPNTDQVKGRAPLTTLSPLPWNDVYYWSFGAAVPYARILSQALDQQHLNRISVDERWRLRDYLDEDDDIIQETGIKVNIAAVPLNEENLQTPNTSLKDDDDTSREHELLPNPPGKIAGDVPTQESPVDQRPTYGDAEYYQLPTGEEVEELLDLFDYEMSEDNPHSPMLDIVTYDLREVKDFGSPQDFLNELIDMKRIQQEHREQTVRAARNDVAQIRNSLAKCPRELVNRPTRSLSVPPNGFYPAHASVSGDRLRAWFHLRGQQANDDTPKAHLCAKDEERYRAFASRVGIIPSDQEQELPVGVEDGNDMSRIFARERSLPPSAPSDLYPSITVQQLRTWYHLWHARATASVLDSHGSAAADHGFIRFAFNLGLDIADLEDMDLPVIIDPSHFAIVQTTSATPTAAVPTRAHPSVSATSQAPPSKIKCMDTSRMSKRPRDHDAEKHHDVEHKLDIETPTKRARRSCSPKRSQTL